MDPAREIAFDLLKRLLNGERELVPLNLAMLLEKSARLDRGDDPDDVEEHYRQLRLPNIAGLRLSPEASSQIIETLCAEISKNPDEALISVLSFIGQDLPIKTIVKVLINPPRPLTIIEYSMALSIVNVHLPYRLVEDPEFLLRADLERLLEITEKLMKNQERETGMNRSAQICIDHHAPQLLESLKRRIDL